MNSMNRVLLVGGNSQLTVTLVTFALGQLSILLNDFELEGGAEIPSLYEDSAEWYAYPKWCVCRYFVL